MDGAIDWSWLKSCKICIIKFDLKFAWGIEVQFENEKEIELKNLQSWKINYNFGKRRHIMAKIWNFETFAKCLNIQLKKISFRERTTNLLWIKSIARCPSKWKIKYLQLAKESGYFHANHIVKFVMQI
jgi:hypothetical protein